MAIYYAIVVSMAVMAWLTLMFWSAAQDWNTSKVFLINLIVWTHLAILGLAPFVPQDPIVVAFMLPAGAWIAFTFAFPYNWYWYWNDYFHPPGPPVRPEKPTDFTSLD